MYIVYSKPQCLACKEAKILLALNVKHFGERILDEDSTLEELMELAELLGLALPRSFPVIHCTETQRLLTLTELKEELK